MNVVACRSLPDNFAHFVRYPTYAHHELKGSIGEFLQKRTMEAISPNAIIPTSCLFSVGRTSIYFVRFSTRLLVRTPSRTSGAGRVDKAFGKFGRQPDIVGIKRGYQFIASVPNAHIAGGADTTIDVPSMFQIANLANVLCGIFLCD